MRGEEKGLRNIAIVAHVDHGKTTLIDALLRQFGVVHTHRSLAERAMDSGDLERERGITILAKVASLHLDSSRINIVDTPGHADFGGEVERILDMIDGAILLIDAAEGPMPQTKFVLSKALERGLRPIVAVNKIDRPDARLDEVVNETFDLFAALGANDDQLDFPLLYGSAKEGWMAPDPSDPHEDMRPLLETVLRHVPSPSAEEGPFRMLVTILEADPYLGRVLTGRIASGSAKLNMAVKVLSREGSLIETGRLSKLLAFRGLERQPIEEAFAGDIVAVAGLTTATVAQTICDPSTASPLLVRPVDPPTLSVTFRINDGPLSGKEGSKTRGQAIQDRLLREAEGDVVLTVSRTTEAEAFDVAGRGELQLSILMETMRREGFEFCISRPCVLFSRDADGGLTEPVEEVIIDVDDQFSGIVIQKMSERRATLKDMSPSGGEGKRLLFHAPTRGMIGYRNELLSDTQGTAVMNRLFLAYAPYFGPISFRSAGVLIAHGDGNATAYALSKIEERGSLFVAPGTPVYAGMIVGMHKRGEDLEVNVVRNKKLTNMRASGKDENVRLTPPLQMTLEQALAFIDEDEWIEATPRSIRLRKAILDPHERKKRNRLGQSPPA